MPRRRQVARHTDQVRHISGKSQGPEGRPAPVKSPVPSAAARRRRLHVQARPPASRSACKICNERDVEFNIEGNPFSEPVDPFQGYVNLVNRCQPDQATLVPDLPNQITSDHGWESGYHDDDLINVIRNLNNLCKKTSISLFVDNLKNNNTNLDAIDYALKVGANTIEIHTGTFSKLIDLSDYSIKPKLEELIHTAKDKNLMVNAGHDLNLINLPHLVKIGGVNEVSIGHAIVVDALNYGFEDTIKRYIEVIKG